MRLGEFYNNFFIIQKCYNVYVHSKFKVCSGPQLKLKVDFFYMKANTY